MMEQGCPLSLPECHALKSLSFILFLFITFVYILNVLYLLEIIYFLTGGPGPGTILKKCIKPLYSSH